MQTAIWLPALASALCFGLALVLTQFGLRRPAPIPGAAISIPTTTLMLLAVAPVLTVAGVVLLLEASPVYRRRRRR